MFESFVFYRNALKARIPLGRHAGTSPDKVVCSWVDKNFILNFDKNLSMNFHKDFDKDIILDFNKDIATAT